MELTAPTSDRKPTRVFARILLMLRPQWGTIALAVGFLLLSLPAELFPGVTWMYVTDQLILHNPSRLVAMLHWMFSFNGAVTSTTQLLVSAVLWMFVVYLCAELFGTLSTYM